MDFKTLFEKSWKLTIQNIIILILMTIVLFLVSLITFGILAPVILAGFLYSINQLICENHEPKIQDLFSQMHLFLPLLGFSVVCTIIVSIGFMMLYLPGVFLLVAIPFACLYMLPYMVDLKLNLLAAILKSIETIQKNFLEHLIAFILFMGISWLGTIVAIGWLFTLPLGCVFLMCVYNETKH